MNSIKYVRCIASGSSYAEMGELYEFRTEDGMPVYKIKEEGDYKGVWGGWENEEIFWEYFEMLEPEYEIY